jgi:simple sugar transport system ATP-binding protein
VSSDLRLELSGISKQFGSVRALRGADFSLARGEVHALLGENGAGKSTLMHIAFGMVRPDAGTVRVDGKVAGIRSPRDARALGMGMVHQHPTSIGALTVAENVELVAGRRIGRWAGEGPLTAGLDPNALVETLPMALRQRLEIVKALATGATILLLDEPSAVLAPSEVEELLALVRSFVAGGGAAVLITHKLSEVFVAADRVTVLRNGAVSRHGFVERETERSLAAAMIGGGPPGVEPPARSAIERREVLTLDGLPIFAGEITGVAAVAGNGQRELLRAMASGSGVAFVPEDRTTEGLIPALSVTENIVLGLPDDPRWTRGFRVDWAAARKRTVELIAEFDIKTAGPDARVATLSGGNQQKVILARALERGPRALLAEDPTHGLDIRATAEVHSRLRRTAADGVAVVMYSSDLDEVLELADRVLVVVRGRVLEAPAGADRRRVGEMMLGLVSGQR